MTIKKKDQSVDLQLTGEGSVFLTITIGNAQKGSNFLKFEGASQPLAKGEITKLNLGSPANVAGNILDVTTNILDTNDASNRVVATYVFTGCKPAIITDDDVVDNDGDVYSLLTKFTFKSNV